MALQDRVNNVRLKVDLEGGQRRLEEAIVYIARHSEADERFSAIKLNKILFKADFDSYAERGRPVTGRVYQRLKMGPAPVELVPLRREMERRRVIDIKVVTYFGREQHRVVALRAPDLSLFDSKDIEYLDRAIRDLWELNADQVSSDSHGVQWRTRHDRDRIPYETAYLSDDELSPEAAERLRRKAIAGGWLRQPCEP